MKRKSGFLLAACCILFIQIPGLCADPSPEQLIAAHLKSIGDPAILSKIKSISFTGTSEVNFIIGVTGRFVGTAMLASQETQTGIILKFEQRDYAGEHFAYDGKSVTVHTSVGMKSNVGDFIYRYNKIMKNGMLGGVFSRAWPLLDIKNNKPRSMNVRKTKVDGTELYELEYRPLDDHGDMKIRMYFNPATYRHVRTEYKVTYQDSDSRNYYLTLTEKFDDFMEVGPLTLPHGYMLDYAEDGNQAGFAAKWKINVGEIRINKADIDPKIFNAE